MAETGRILRIEKLSSFDGEGLRTVVFLKGCPLACRWCSTPESQQGGTDFGVNRNKCTGCFDCTEACPEQALAWDMKRERFITDPAKCTDCRNCIAACPTGARQAWGYTATSDEIFREVEKDSLFYFHSGGGVTLSGGEPLAQAGFTAELLKKCRDHGMNTAMETSGMAPWESVEKVLPHLDTLFFDLKQMDNNRHKAITGVGNRHILENLERIDESPHNRSLVVRMPVIPGLNDTKDNINALGGFCNCLKKLAQVQLLPYHRLGVETYRRMGIPYAQEAALPPDDTTMQALARQLKNMGLAVRVGG